jgi:N-carbamoylputrescine amidase
MKVGLVQFAAVPEPEDNLAEAVRLIGKAAAEGAELVLPHELVSTQYFPAFPVDDAYFDLAEPLDGPTVTALREAAVLGDCAVLAPWFERVGPGRYFNSAALIGPGGEIRGIWRKTHIPRVQVDDGAGGLMPVDEKYYFEPGPVPYQVCRLGGVTVGVLICHDRHFPEVARGLALAGAELLLVPATSRGIPEAPDVVDVWRTELRATAIQDMAWVCATNRVGTEGRQTFLGHSGVFGPRGEVLASAGDGAEVVVAEVPVGEIESLRRARGFLRDRRPDTYGALVGEVLPGC